MEQRIILETDRLFLREMNMDDLDALYEVLADKNIMQHYPYVLTRRGSMLPEIGYHIRADQQRKGSSKLPA